LHLTLLAACGVVQQPVTTASHPEEQALPAGLWGRWGDKQGGALLSQIFEKSQISVNVSLEAIL
jgi:hypothetical protein